MKIIIPIQSLSDIITNSSSELFCVVFDTDTQKYKSIIESWFNDYDYGFDVEISDDRYAEECLFGDESEERLPFKGKCLIVHVEQHQTVCGEFLKEGMTAMLNKHIGKDNYKVIYSEEF